MWYPIFLVYIDDLIITGNDSQFIFRIMQQLEKQFFLKDLGQLNFFLGIKEVSTPAGLFLSLHKYIQELLAKTTMDGAEEVTTLLCTSVPLRLCEDTTNVDASHFRQVLGSLQYLSLTQPDICYVVNKLS